LAASPVQVRRVRVRPGRRAGQGEAERETERERERERDNSSQCYVESDGRLGVGGGREGGGDARDVGCTGLQ
jgi:hypothetical protein